MGLCGFVWLGNHNDFREFPHSWEVGGSEHGVKDFGEKDDCFFGVIKS